VVVGVGQAVRSLYSLSERGEDRIQVNKEQRMRSAIGLRVERSGQAPPADLTTQNAVSKEKKRDGGGADKRKRGMEKRRLIETSA